MPHSNNPLEIRYAALSDTGLVRDSNQDAVYAGSRLLAVADGFGASGAHASTVAIDVLKDLDTDATIPAGDLLNTLHDAVNQANQAIHDIAQPDDSGQMVGTTLTALLWTGSQLALVHIGDSRAYLLRSGELFQITHDHTFVQSMVDEGHLSPAEAASHPRVVSTITQPRQAVRELVGITHHAGAPDNVSCGVADVAELRQ